MSTLSKESCSLLAKTSQYQGSGLDFSYYSHFELGIRNGSVRRSAALVLVLTVSYTSHSQR